MIIGNTERGFEAYSILRDAGYDVLIEDRDIRMSEAMREGLMFGFPMYVIAGQRTKRGKFEFICKRAGIRKEIDQADLLDEMMAARVVLEAVGVGAECLAKLSMWMTETYLFMLSSRIIPPSIMCSITNSKSEAT